MGNNVTSLINHAILQVEQNSPLLAIKTLQEAIKIAPDYCDVHWQMARAYYEYYRQNLRKTHLKTAREYVNNCLAIYPQYAHAHYLAGLILTAQGKLKKAETYYRKAIDIEPESPVYHMSLGNNLLLRNHKKKANIHIEKALELDPQNLRALTTLGRIEFYANGKTEKAKDYARAALTVDNSDINALVLMGTILYRERRYADAKDLARQAISQNPRDYESLKLICMIETKRNPFLGASYRLSMYRYTKYGMASMLMLYFLLRGGIILVYLYLVLADRFLHRMVMKRYLKDINLRKKF